MSIIALALIIAIVLGAIAAPVVFALRRRARLAALMAGTIGFGAQALLVTYLQSGAVGPEQGALAMLIGIPGVALATCALTMFFIARYTSPAKS